MKRSLVILYLVIVFYNYIITPLTSTNSCVSLNGEFSKPRFLPGELDKMKPKSICIICPSESSKMLPLCLQQNKYVHLVLIFKNVFHFIQLHIKVITNTVIPNYKTAAAKIPNANLIAIYEFFQRLCEY